MLTKEAAAQDFDQFYADCLAEKIVRLEADRRRAQRWAFLVMALIILAAGAVVYFYFAQNGFEPFPTVFLLAGAAGFGWCAGVAIVKRAVRNFKPMVIQPLVEFANANLTYEAHSGISRRVFTASQLFNKRIDRYRHEDYVGGKLGKTAVEFSEIHAEYKTTTTDSRGRRRTKWHDIFKGVFFVADFNKHFQGTTLVLPDVAEKALGGWLGGWLQKAASITRPGDLVKLEDAEFEKRFVVYSTDQVEARYILTPALMAQLTELAAELPAPPFISFTQTNIHIALVVGKNLFEPRLFRQIADVELLRSYYTTLQFLLGIVDDLSLNQRLWTKK